MWWRRGRRQRAGAGGTTLDRGPSRVTTTARAGGSSTTTGDSVGIPTNSAPGEGVPATAADGTPTTDPKGPDIQLYANLECSFLPASVSGGADRLNIMVAVENIGAGVPHSVQMQSESETGLMSSERVKPVLSYMQALGVDLEPDDFGRKHVVVITADPDHEIVERDESNNKLTITVTMPARPTRSSSVGCMSPKQFS